MNQAEILIYQDIEEGLDKVIVDRLRSIGSNPVTVRLNTNGGDVFAGLAIYNALAQHPGRVTTRCDGLAASAGSVILLAGKEIQAAENSIVMIHNAWSVAIGNAREIRDFANVLDKVDSQMTGIYATRTGMPREKIMGMMRSETWLTAQEAQRFGFVDKILPNAGHRAHVDKSRFNNVPAWALNERQAEIEERHAVVLRRLAISELRSRNNDLMRRYAPSTN